jgi:hypothetical protein
MKTELGYKGYFQYKDKTWGNISTDIFDPASITKIFYISFLFAKYKKEELESIKLKLTVSHLSSYSYGTVKLDYRSIGAVFTLSELASNSLNYSCNVSTGMLADFLNRDLVNEYIHNNLGLLNTTVFSQTSKNSTNIIDLWKFGRQLIAGKKHQIFLEFLNYPKRRAVISNYLTKEFKVYSKGGTTFEGCRRDWGLIFDGKEWGSFLIIQEIIDTPKFSFIDKQLAKFHLGKKHQFLKLLDKDFISKSKEIIRFSNETKIKPYIKRTITAFIYRDISYISFHYHKDMDHFYQL